ncbi:unnamed protein product [Effrenium voratum]|nr:unnamed protein product [Effrenium voratum]
MILQGRHGVVRRFPIVPGIDMAGVVLESGSPLFSPGDEVVLTGNKIGQHVDGGYSERCSVQAEWLVPRPRSFSLEECMAIGTAGFTAMQMVMELEECGRLQTSKGPCLVLGAGGGAGSACVAILAQRGYEASAVTSVVAATGRKDQLREYLTDLGAKEVVGRLAPEKRALAEQRWQAVLDCAGGPQLSAALAQLRYRGAAACIGVAGGGELEASVYPFVLRGVRLLGVDSTLPWDVEGLGEDVEEWQRNRRERLGFPQEFSRSRACSADPLFSLLATFPDCRLVLADCFGGNRFEVN